MRRVAKFFMRLYPAMWRERYGEEFESLIEDSSPGWRGMFDLFKGAITMHLHVPAFPKLAVILSLLGVAAGFGVSALVTPRYVSVAQLEIVDASTNSLSTARASRGMRSRWSSAESILT